MNSWDDIDKALECPKILRIGIFFDGTGNNLFNDAKDIAAIKVKSSADHQGKNAAYKSELAAYNKDQPAAQKEDKRSNIAKLYSLYKDSSTAVGQKIQIHRSIYKQGIGTNAGEENHMPGLAFGSGGAKRINEAISEVMGMLNAHSEKEYERIIDVFGFSRGAAQARDFINTFYYHHGRLKYTFGFVGIYDTVGSFGIAGDNENYKPKNPEDLSEHSLAWRSKDNFEPYNFNLCAESANRIVHMTAAHEYRENFPLSDIAKTTGKHAEWQYVGVHSDVGGGYAENYNQEGLDIDIIDKKHFNKNKEKKLIRLEIHKAQQQGYQVKIEPLAHSARVSSVNVVMTIFKKRFVLQDLAKVTLHLMHEEARDKGVPLEDLPTDDSYSIPKELEAYYQHAKAHKGDTTGFRGAAAIKEKWAHRSHYDWNDKPDPGRKISNPARIVGGKMEREVFPNKPAKAITPT